MAEDINEEVYNWIETTMKTISDESRWNRKT
jgi:hypothetical protein